MKKLLVSGLLLIVGTWAPLATALTLENPYQLIDEVAQSTFDRLNNEQQKIKADPKYLRTIVREEMLPGVDVRFSAYRVIGKQLNNTTAEQREQFVDAFSEYLVVTYADALAAYDDQTLDIGTGKVTDADKLVSIPVAVLEPNKPKIQLEFKLRKNNRTGEWRVFDMIAEGISLLSAKQGELSGLIRQKGIEQVTQELYAHTNKPVTPLERKE
ncbi:phospholipid-binding protein MlaC [Oceanisphaera pacifica]|uniref:Phospholipid-binding protein MlaC n=1 Tax=Oceanisphaera pacifica TaxID=2818389 RepID=A0ABS3NFF3_9GAMM|nr:phospholipid-binding protein MlaC [Oceanisphaera pacifica]MBO1519267.1 phospholipid-binding protein MlaC [Oceanisphaera pacifica]